MVQEHRLTIPAVLENVGTACEFVRKVALAAGMSADAIHHCYLSVEEMCINVIEHGYQYDGSDEVIDVICEHHPDRLSITIIDDAAPFNPLNRPAPNPNAPLVERRGGGWGIYFVKRYMDRVDYYHAGNRNHFAMEKNF